MYFKWRKRWWKWS